MVKNLRNISCFSSFLSSLKIKIKKIESIRNREIINRLVNRSFTRTVRIVLAYSFGLISAFSFFLSGVPVNLKAQNYIPITHTATYPNNVVEYEGNGSFVQDNDGLIFIGNSHGLIEFDGRQKNFFPVESPIFSLDLHSPTNTIHAACEDGFGYFRRNSSGKFEFTDLSKKIQAPNRPNDAIGKVFVVGDQVIYYYPSRIYIVGIKDQAVKHIPLTAKDGSGGSMGAFRLNNQIYIQFPDKGICKLQAENIVPTLSDPQIAMKSILYSCPFSSTEVLISTNDNKLFVFDGKTIRPFAPQLSGIIASTNDQVVGLAVLENGLVITATSLNGSLVFNKKTEATVSILNIRYGLPSNDASGIFSDRDGRLWIAHSEKFSWCYVNFPINKYDQGFTGNVNDVIHTDNIYIATDNGVYYFTKYRNADVISEELLSGVINQFKKIKPIVVERLPIPEVKTAQQIQQTIQPQIKMEVTPEKKGILETAGGLFKGKKKKEREAAEAAERQRLEQERINQEKERIKLEAERQAAAEEAARQAVILQNQQAEAARQAEIAERARIAQMYEELRASRQVTVKSIDFDLIPNTPEEKFTSLIEFKGMLLAGSVNGLYTIAANRITPVYKTPIKMMRVSAKNPNRVYIVGSENRVGMLNYTNNEWSYQQVNGFKDFVHSIAEDFQGNLWLGSPKGTIQLDIEKAFTATPTIKRISPIQDVQSGLKNVEVKQIGNEMIALQDGKIFYWNGKGFVVNDKLSQLAKGASNISIVAANPADSTKTTNQYWFLAGSAIYKIKAENQLSQISVLDSSKILAIAERLSSFFADKSNQLWFAGNHRVLQYYPDKVSNESINKKFKCIIRSVHTIEVKNDRIVRTPVEHLSELFELPYQSHYNLEFDFAAPLFDNPDNYKYQYKIGGNDSWKDIDVTKLNLEFAWGEYEFKVRAIDAFGNISEEAIFSFSIAPPYWARWYFWLLVVGTLGFGGYTYFQMRQKSLIQRKKELESEVERATEQIRDQNQKLESSNGLLQQQSQELQKQNEQLEKFNVEIAEQKEISDKLLLNILPYEIAQELKEKKSADARRYDMVSVLFTDFKGFTMIAEKMTAEELIVELDKAFMIFDEIMDRYGIEKIKTLGDGYMSAGGIPNPNVSNPIDIVLAGLEIQAAMSRYSKERTKQGKDSWQVRLGIHTGELVAGVIGKRKFAYDIWGDTVNTASRMESSGESGKVNISGQTYEYIKDFFECTYRGQVSAKNKGEISMYFVERIKKNLSADPEGLRPNDKFFKKLDEYKKNFAMIHNTQNISK